MREITVKVFKFDELTDKAKERARDWYREGGLDSEYAWEHVKEDARNVGLRILSLDQHRANKGTLDRGAVDTAKRIMNDHGSACETFKTAKRFLDQRAPIAKAYDEAEAVDDVAVTDELYNTLETLDVDFLRDLLEDYRVMLEKDIEWSNSAEAVDENIIANDYEFLENGKRA